MVSTLIKFEILCHPFVFATIIQIVIVDDFVLMKLKCFALYFVNLSSIFLLTALFSLTKAAKIG